MCELCPAVSREEAAPARAVCGDLTFKALQEPTFLCASNRLHGSESRELLLYVEDGTRSQPVLVPRQGSSHSRGKRRTGTCSFNPRRKPPAVWLPLGTALRDVFPSDTWYAFSWASCWPSTLIKISLVHGVVVFSFLHLPRSKRVARS